MKDMEQFFIDLLYTIIFIRHCITLKRNLQIYAFFSRSIFDNEIDFYRWFFLAAFLSISAGWKLIFIYSVDGWRLVCLHKNCTKLAEFFRTDGPF